MIKIYDFYAKWCGPCLQMEPTVRMMMEKFPRLVRKVDVDKDAELALKFGVTSIPLLVAVKVGDGREEEVLERLLGKQTKADLLTFFNKYGEYNGKQ